MLVLTLYFEKNPPSHILGFEEKIDYNNNFLITKDILALLLKSKKKKNNLKRKSISSYLYILNLSVKHFMLSIHFIALFILQFIHVVRFIQSFIRGKLSHCISFS